MSELQKISMKDSRFERYFCFPACSLHLSYILHVNIIQAKNSQGHEMGESHKAIPMMSPKYP